MLMLIFIINNVFTKNWYFFNYAMDTADFVGFTVLLAALIMVYAVCVRQAVHLMDAQLGDVAYAVANPLEFVFERNGIVDCTHTRLPCVTNRQCVDNCAMQNALGTMICDQGFCVSRDALVAGGRPDDFECDAALGLIKVYVASEFVVDQMCISTYRDLFDDEGKPRPYVCDAGTLNVDLAERQFTPDDCNCSPGYTRMVFVQTALARSVPVCVPNATVDLFRKIYY
ncbi:pif-3 [Artaxa digramma nucleopolyhedrovirus]|uniref:Pif-3 n=1 Tax=Artaxa digramma nucleopolyhedrovirus TaxID=3070910 RepID=A0AAE6R7L8_9ABAC|nr:pif-3 [Euproctis digramma nucleopolyhedrovirus]QHB21768.1 pif-3 [Artaxa digramma nucleopolyhedrovirus]